MKVIRKEDNKEVKDATVIYNVNGVPELVEVKGVQYDVKAFELEEDKPKTKKKSSSKSK